VHVAVDRDDETLSIAVTDEGEGIPESERRRVLDPFYRGRSARRRGVPGAGLGLALVRRVAEAHGGAVEIDGRRVALVLPLGREGAGGERGDA
jgi:signal transduction histidine kinase